MLALPAAVGAVNTSFWDLAGKEEIGEGTVRNLMVGPLGTLSLSPSLEDVGGISEYYVWCLAPDGKGNLYVGTGDEGRIYRVDRKGESTLIFDSVELDVLSIAVAPDGTVYAGTSPDGVIYAIDTEGKARTFFDTPEHYVWSLLVDEKGDVYAGTGENGKIYRVDPSGEGIVFYDSPETNILCLVRDAPRERILAGGDGNGLLIALDADANASVLFDSPRNEIGDIALAGDGTIYVAAAGDESADRKKKNGEPRRKALLFRVAPTGAVEQIWESDSEYLFALLLEDDGSLLVGTGNPGQLVRIDAEGNAAELATLAESQLLALQKEGDVTWVGTGNQGGLYTLGGEGSREGTYESEAKDMVNVTRWGTLRWWGDVPAKTSLRFSTRSGNTEEANRTWSDWEEIDSGRSGGAIRSPAARFLQWRAEMKSEGESSPRLDRVRIAYVEQNLAPRVLAVNVGAAEASFFEGPSDPRPELLYQVLGDGTRVEYYPPSQGDTKPVAASEMWTRSIRTARWDAADPNGDDLYFDIFYRREGDERWKPMEKDLTMNYYSWDSRSMPDGDYRIKVVARDERSNPPASALIGARIGDPFEVDNTPPEVVSLTVKRRDGRLAVKGKARDETSPLLRAEYSLNADAWQPVACADGIYDSWEEEFDFAVDSSGGGEQVILLRVTDQAGNSALGKAVIR